MKMYSFDQVNQLPTERLEAFATDPTVGSYTLRNVSRELLLARQVADGARRCLHLEMKRKKRWFLLNAFQRAVITANLFVALERYDIAIGRSEPPARTGGPDRSSHSPS